MNILRKNTIPVFQIVTRENLNTDNVFKIQLKNEDTQAVQEINATVSLLENENYTITLDGFPVGNIHEKFSYTIIEVLTENVVSLGKILIVGENENVQDYTTIETNNFYN